MLPLQPTPYSKDYEITDAMFGAFRSPGGMPFFWKLFGWMTLAQGVLYAIFMPTLFKSYGNFLMVAIEMGDDPSTEQSLEIMSNLSSMIPVILLLSVLSFITMGVVRAAFFRGYFFGDTGGAFPFRFGKDEVRQSLAILGYWGVYLLTYLIPYILIIIVTVILIGLLGDAGVMIAAIIGFVGVIGLMVFLVWVMVTISPAGALTALRQQTHIIAARHVSKNRFWALFGSYLVAGLIGYVVCYIAMVFGFVIGLAGFFNADVMNAFVAEGFQSVMERMTNFSKSSGFKVGVFFAILMSSAGMAFYSLIMAGPQAYFTRQWAEAGATAYDLTDEH